MTYLARNTVNINQATFKYVGAIIFEFHSTSKNKKIFNILYFTNIKDEEKK
jgi:hypothetical protein